jgi:prohibitin 2
MGILDDRAAERAAKVASDEQRLRTVVKRSIIGVGLVVTFMVGYGMRPIATVPAGYRGVMTTFGNPSETIYDQGIHYRTPISQEMHLVYVGTNRVDAKVAGSSHDLQTVSLDLALNYHIDPSKAVSIYRDLGNDEVARVIEPAMQETTKAALAHYTAEELITKRDEVNTAVEAAIHNRLAPFGIVAENTALINFEFSQTFNNAIEAKITAQQKALQSENEVNQTKWEQQKLVVESEAQKQIAINNAAAIKSRGEALAANPAVLEQMRIDKWDGHYPQYMMGGNSIPLIQVGK